MSISVTSLRANIFQVIDKVIRTGKPVTVERKGERVKIMVEKKKSKLENIVPHPDCIVGDPENLVHVDWSTHWGEEKLLK